MRSKKKAINTTLERKATQNMGGNVSWRNLLLGALAFMMVVSAVLHMSAIAFPGVLDEGVDISVVESQLHPEAFVAGDNGAIINLRGQPLPTVLKNSAPLRTFDTSSQSLWRTQTKDIYSLDKLRDIGYANGLIKLDDHDPEGAQRLKDCPTVSRHVVYWRHLPEDKFWESPYKNLGPENKYLLFEPDEGGWNNLRLGFEANLALAFATGRTLVLPPRDRVYLLNKGSPQQEQKLKKLFKPDRKINARAPMYGFEDIFAMESLRERLRVLTMEEFIIEVINDPSNNEIPRPREELTELVQENKFLTWRNPVLKKWIESISVQPKWNPSKVFLAFPRRDRLNNEGNEKFSGAQLNAGMKPWKKRHREPAFYDEKLQNTKVLFLPQCRGAPCRMLTQFYSFLYFADDKDDKVLKRFIRDHLHYNSDILCTGARIIDLILKDANSIKNDNDEENAPLKSYSSGHVRRNDFQYKEARHAPLDDILDVMWKHTKIHNEVLYLSTDEKDKSVLAPLSVHYQVKLLGDYAEKVRFHEVDPNYVGMIEQVVASKGRVFIGTWWSTFTAYIMRMRGYRGLNHQSFYYPKPFENEMQRFQHPEGLGWWREWDPAWYQLDE